MYGRSGGGTGQNVDLEVSAGVMLVADELCQSAWHGFRVAGAGEAAHGHGHARLNESGSLFCAHQ